MNPMVNLNIVLEKELELERQGFRRTRRWIGDASSNTNPNWYEAKASRVPTTRHNVDQIIQLADTKPHREANRSILARIFNLPYTNQQPAKSQI